MSNDMEDILNIFFEECDEYLPQLEEGLNSINGGDHSPETINAIFRAVHSIKGGAGSFGLDRLVRFAHVYENALDKLRSNEISPSEEIIKVMLLAMDVLSDLVSEAKGTASQVDEARISDALNQLENIKPKHEDPSYKGNDIETASESEHIPNDFQPIPVNFDIIELDSADESVNNKDGAIKQAFEVTFRPAAGLYERGDDARNLLNSLVSLIPNERQSEIEVTCLYKTDISIKDVKAENPSLTWSVTLPAIEGITKEHILDVFDWVNDVCSIDIKEPIEPETETNEDTFVPVKFAGSLDDIIEDAASETEEATSQAELPANIVDAPTAPHKKKEHAGGSIRVDTDRIGALMNLVGEMVIAQASLESALSQSSSSDDGEMLKRISTMKALVRDIQSNVMSMRAQPVKTVFQRMNRVVRESSALAGKDIQLILEGEDTEVDRTLIENLSDPLTHMLRNAVDHGIEPVEKRREAGKDERGTIWLSASHKSGRIVIEIRDNGGGINTSKVQEIALKRGIISPSDNLTENEINELIFAPGFSTAEKVSDLSGRGVGMDVVKAAIHTLGGRVSIQSVEGEGTIFTLSLPLTLAVLDGMLIECSGSVMVVPVASVIELVTASYETDIYAIPDGSHVVSVRGQCVPLIYLSEALELPDHKKTSELQQIMVLIVENEEGARGALVVDKARDQVQVVIKSIEKNYRRIEGVSAATILGDGSVSLILDISTLISKAIKRLDTRNNARFATN